MRSELCPAHLSIALRQLGDDRAPHVLKVDVGQLEGLCNTEHVLSQLKCRPVLPPHFDDRNTGTCGKGPRSGYFCLRNGTFGLTSSPQPSCRAAVAYKKCVIARSLFMAVAGWKFVIQNRRAV